VKLCVETGKPCPWYGLVPAPGFDQTTHATEHQLLFVNKAQQVVPLWPVICQKQQFPSQLFTIIFLEIIASRIVYLLTKRVRFSSFWLHLEMQITATATSNTSSHLLYAFPSLQMTIFGKK